MQHIILGKKGEALACEYLQKAKYKIREVNYQLGRNEIDIIASQGKYIVFVEVKTRSQQCLIAPEMAVNWRKQNRIIKIANAYMIRHQLHGMEARFDIIGIRYKNNKNRNNCDKQKQSRNATLNSAEASNCRMNFSILHIPNAYYPC